MNTNKKIYRLVFAALSIALCFVGGNIKIMGSIAFDSLPAFLGTLFLGYGWGAAIGALAHMLSAMLSGFPMTLPVHIITAGMMALTMVGLLATVRALKKKNEIVAYIMGCIVAVIINVPLGLMAVIPFKRNRFCINSRTFARCDCQCCVSGNNLYGNSEKI